MPCIKTNFKLVCSSFFKKKQPITPVETAWSATKSIVSTFSVTAMAALIAACSSRPMPPQSPAPIPIPAPAPVFTPQPTPEPVPPAAGTSRLPSVASWADYRRRAAQMILATNPGASFTGAQPAQWKGIATVTVILNADGSIRNMDLMRGSRVSPEVNDMALAAARRAGNYGPIGNLPQPWQFNETFLYNDNNKFQLITIIEGR